MPALRTLGLVILAILAVSIGILGYVYMRAVFDDSAARSAVDKVAAECGAVVASGGTQTVEITIPGNYQMRFLDNQITIDNYRVPKEGFVFGFSESAPELGPGTYTLSITIQDGRLVVTRI
jgi:hypothetical protein